MTDLWLAIGHHLLVFTLLGLLVAEAMMLRPQMSVLEVRRVASLDGLYGLTAVAVIAVGVCRVFFGLKGPEAYVHNPWFWAKMAAFAVVGLASIGPTVTLIGWNGRLKRDPSDLPESAAIAKLRRYLTVELAAFAAIPVFAAARA